MWQCHPDRRGALRNMTSIASAISERLLCILPPTMRPPPQPLAPDLRSRFTLREGIAFLNHGSFGAVPRVVFEEQESWRRRIEAEPIEMLGRRHAELVEEAKRPLGELLNMGCEEFGLVTNATEGVNA